MHPLHSSQWTRRGMMYCYMFAAHPSGYEKVHHLGANHHSDKRHSFAGGLITIFPVGVPAIDRM